MNCGNLKRQLDELEFILEWRKVSAYIQHNIEAEGDTIYSNLVKFKMVINKNVSSNLADQNMRLSLVTLKVTANGQRNMNNLTEPKTFWKGKIT